MTRCGAVETQTGRQCVLEPDHEGVHVMQSPLGRMRFDDMTEAAFESILEARRGISPFERLRRENERLREENERLRKGINAVYALIQESYGVAGLHLNGAIATWDELLLSSPPTAWLEDLADVLPEPLI